MEPTLHCAKPGAWCEGRFDDRVVANRVAYRFGNPKRGQIVVFTAPTAAERCGRQDGGSTFVKRIVGLPGDMLSERGGVIYINGERLVEPYLDALREGARERELATRRARPLLRHGRQQDSLLRLPHMGNGVPEQPHRSRDADVLAAQPRLVPLEPRSARTGDTKNGLPEAFAPSVSVELANPKPERPSGRA